MMKILYAVAFLAMGGLVTARVYLAPSRLHPLPARNWPFLVGLFGALWFVFVVVSARGRWEERVYESVTSPYDMCVLAICVLGSVLAASGGAVAKVDHGAFTCRRYRIHRLAAGGLLYRFRGTFGKKRLFSCS